MERLRQLEREKQWTCHVRETVRNGGRRRAARIVTVITWAILLSALGVMGRQVYIQHSQLDQLRREEARLIQLAAAQGTAEQTALEDQLAQLTQDNDALRARLDMAAEELKTVRAAAEEAEEELKTVRAAAEEAEEALAQAQAQAQAPKVAGPAYTALYPDLYATSSRRETLAPDNTVYLTFDDGPSARTAEILDILKENDIKATFFVTGQTSSLAQEMMRRIVAEGHTIAIHTYTHDYEKIYASVEAFLDDFNRIYHWVHEVTGVYPQIFRFPGGTVNSYNESLYCELVAEMDRRGFVHYDWNAMCGDADGKPHTPEELARNSLAMLGAKRAIILMHDSAVRATTVACLPAVIAGYRNAGYTFAPLTPEVKAITFDQ